MFVSANHGYVNYVAALHLFSSHSLFSVLVGLGRDPDLALLILPPQRQLNTVVTSLVLGCAFSLMPHQKKTSSFVASDMAGNRLGVLFKNSQRFHALKC